MIKAKFDTLSTNQKYDAMFELIQKKENLDSVVAVPPSIITATIKGSEKHHVLFPPGVLKTIYFHVPPFESKTKKVELTVSFSELGKTSFGGKTYTLGEKESSLNVNLELSSGGLYELSKVPTECVVYLCALFYSTDPRGWMRNTIQRKMFLEE